MSIKYRNIIIAIVILLILVFSFRSCGKVITNLFIGQDTSKIDSLQVVIASKDKIIDSLRIKILENKSQLSKIVYKPIYVDKNKIITNEEQIKKLIHSDSITIDNDIIYWRKLFSK